jgi:hypothetical protein
LEVQQKDEIEFPKDLEEERAVWQYLVYSMDD